MGCWFVNQNRVCILPAQQRSPANVQHSKQLFLMYSSVKSMPSWVKSSLNSTLLSTSLAWNILSTGNGQCPVKFAFEQMSIFLCVIRIWVLGVQKFCFPNSPNRCFYHFFLFFFSAVPKGGEKTIWFLSQWNRFWKKHQTWLYMSGMRWDKTRGARALGQPALPCWDTNTALARSPALLKHTHYSCKLVTTCTALYVCAFVVCDCGFTHKSLYV